MKRWSWLIVIVALAIVAAAWLTRRQQREPAPRVPKPSATGPAPATTPVVASAADAFAQWLAAHSSRTEPPPLVQGIRLAQQRRAELKELIQRDPQRALALAVPPEQRAGLPPEVVAELEEWVSGRGFYGVIAVDYEDGRSETLREVQLGEKRYRAFVYGRMLAQTSKQDVPLWGIAVDDVLALGEWPFRVVTSAPGRITVDVAGQRRTFGSEAELKAYEAAWERALARPGPQVEEPK